MRGIFYLAHKNSNDPFPYEDIRKKLGSFEKYNNFYENKSEYEGFIVSLLDKTEEPFFFESGVVAHLHRYFDKKEHSISLDKLDKIRNDYFKRYLGSTARISRDAFYFYYNCRPRWNMDSIQVFDGEGNTNETNKLFIGFIKEKALNSFLELIISPDHHDMSNRYKITDDVRHIFGDYKRFEDFLSKIDKKDKSFLDEFILFYEKCKKNQYNYVDYEFKKLNVPKVENKPEENKKWKHLIYTATRVAT